MSSTAHAGRAEILHRALYFFLAARLALVGISVADPTGGVLTDSGGYLGLAAGLLENGRYGVQPDGEADLLWPPAYPAFLALVQVLFGAGTYKVTFLQLAMSGLTSLVLLALGRELGRPNVGLAAAWLYALSPNVAVWSLTIMTEVSFALLLTLATLICLKVSKPMAKGWGPFVGGLLGILAYLRPIAIALTPGWAAAAYWVGRSQASTRRSLLSIGSTLLVTLVAVLPWAYRNWATYGEFTFSTATTEAWRNFNLAEVVAREEGIERSDAVASFDPAKGTVQLTLEVLTRYPAGFVRAQSLGVLRSLVGNDIGTWGNVLDDDSWVGLGLLSGAVWGSLRESQPELNPRPENSAAVRYWIYGYSLLFSSVLIGLALASLPLIRPSTQSERLYLSLALASTAILLLSPGAAGQARFRVPAEPNLAILAGYGLAGLRNTITRRSRLPG